MILVTGTSSGLGRDTANALARDGHDVVVHARSKERLPEGSWAGAVAGDLTSLEDTRRLAAMVDGFGRFDAVHNAGTTDLRDAAAVNIVAPYVLTATMVRPARLIFLSSSMHRSGSSDLRRLERREASYSDTKLWVTALSDALAERWEDTVSHAVDPGWVPTRMGGADAPDDVVQGHTTQVMLATAADVRPASGGYWHHLRSQTPHPITHEKRFHARLIDALERFTGTALG